ncbi:uncharacterized protein EV420DRAFT_117148 [Desarmillaria tabescens]|uniref:Uncharacterized protein n=1 Tax=Armillaria tabescens TaxID=1929756 RepID=A0AA39NRV9_ARMTA|nr:uncharacterized protein EV420DRAFT_117148 [Desarmillaria tabescens]KAK0470479.1 hypothetical protein EV420DRAFT_117148 [Desarmillaria tabescens]
MFLPEPPRFSIELVPWSFRKIRMLSISSISLFPFISRVLVIIAHAAGSCCRSRPVSNDIWNCYTACRSSSGIMNNHRCYSFYMMFSETPMQILCRYLHTSGICKFLYVLCLFFIAPTDP